MKIAILTTDNREHLKHYALPEPVFGTAPEALLQGFALLSGIEVHVVACVREPVRSPERIAPNIFYHSVLVSKIGWMSTGYQGCIRAIRKKLKEIQPDIVHGQGTERDCAITAVFSGFPNVLTIHGNMRLIAAVNKVSPFSYGWLNAYLERFTLPLSDGLVCITNYTREATSSLARRSWVLPNAVDSQFFDVSPKGNAVPEILIVGLICQRKNQNRFIQALDSLAAKCEFRLVFLGQVSKEDPYGAEFFRLLESRPWCEAAGFADRDTLRARFAGAALVALPSLEDNCPMVVLEAMAAGVPVIAADVGGVPDLVRDGENGLLFDPLNDESMAGAVAQIFDHPQKTESMALVAQKEAVERFHPRHIAEQHLAIYRELLCNR